MWCCRPGGVPFVGVGPTIGHNQLLSLSYLCPACISMAAMMHIDGSDDAGSGSDDDGLIAANAVAANAATVTLCNHCFC